MKQLLAVLLACCGVVSANAEEQKATFAGGCFWCMEPPYDKLDGVISTVSGYAGGAKKDPTYEEVSRGGTGHAEVVQVTYDDEKISYQQLLDVFWVNIDPVDPNGQFCDRGSQYRSAIFFHNDKQKRLAITSKEKLQNSDRFELPIVTEINKLDAFYPAEDYHQNYYQEHSIRYKFYRTSCGRDRRLKEVWGDSSY